MKYKNPEMELVELEMVDVITVSDPEYKKDEESNYDVLEDWG